MGIAGLTALTGCRALFGGLDVHTVASSVDSNGQIAAYVSVKDGTTPVTGLTRSDFQISENGAELDKKVTQQMLLDRKSVATHLVVVLVDMSSTDVSRAVSRGVADLVSQARENEQVVVYAFDGTGKLELIGEYPVAPAGSGPEQIEALSSWSVRDPSRDLNGAVVEGLKVLEERLKGFSTPVKVGSLVVFARGGDMAGRVKADALDAALDASGREVFAVGLPNDPSGFSVKELERGTKAIIAQSTEDVGVAFSEMGSRLVKGYEQYYLLGYCSPSRGGERRVRLKVDYRDKEGKESSGLTEGDFSADGFGPNCDPSSTPTFAKPLTDPNAAK